MKKIVGIGDVAIDYYYQCDRWPQLGDKAMASLVKTELGGMISNAIANLGAYGMEVYLIDELYEGHQNFVEKTLEQFRVNNNCLTYSKENITTTTQIMLTGGERTIFINWAKKPRGLKKDQLQHIQSADCIYTTINDLKMLQNVEEVITSKIFKGKIVLDLENNTFESYTKDKAYFDLADIFFINDHGLEKLEKEIKVNALLTDKDKIVVLTKGKEGCEIRTSYHQEVIEGLEVNVVDTTGAGDMFNATYLYALFLGKTPFQSGVIANEAAGQSVRHMGNKNSSLIYKVKNKLMGEDE